jgi:hypothetical protein
LSVTTTDATGAGGGGGTVVTVAVAVPVIPSLVARMIAVPGPTPVTTPTLVTVATDVAELLHTTARPVSVAPVESF